MPTSTKILPVTIAMVSSKVFLPLFIFDQFDLDKDIHIFSDNDPTGLERSIPYEAKILTVNSCGASCTPSKISPGVLHLLVGPSTSTSPLGSLRASSGLQ